MPELPEVETIVREIRPLITGEQIAGVQSLWPKTFVNKAGQSPVGLRIQSVQRHGKYIIFNLEKGYLIIHLRMTGKLSVHHNTVPLKKKKHLRLIVKFSSGKRLLFDDTRKFGRVYYVLSRQDILKQVGPDAFDSAFTFERFYESLKKGRSNIKAFLMSQKWVAGLGNIYTDESLFLAKIHPEQKCFKISKRRAQHLFEAIHFILKRAVENMGSTISDYRDAYGNPGKNQLFFKVYRRAGQPCFECGTLIEKKRVAGRGTHFCPKCQKKRG